jgi:restriction system protein
MNDVVQAKQATAGIPATTSFFTKGAAKFQRRIAHQISLSRRLGIVRRGLRYGWSSAEVE